MSHNQNIELKQKLKELEMENSMLHIQLDEIIGDKEKQSNEDGVYTSNTRLVCYKLISRRVVQT